MRMTHQQRLVNVQILYTLVSKVFQYNGCATCNGIKYYVDEPSKSTFCAIIYIFFPDLKVNIFKFCRAEYFFRQTTFLKQNMIEYLHVNISETQFILVYT